MDTTTEIIQIFTNLTEKLNSEPNTYKPNTQLRLYDILIPLIGVLVIIINFIVVISSGLILKKGKYL